MKTLFVLTALLSIGFASAQGTVSDSVRGQIQQTMKGNRPKPLNNDAQLKSSEPIVSPNPGTTQSATNNGNNRAAGNVQPSTTPGANRTPATTTPAVPVAPVPASGVR